MAFNHQNYNNQYVLNARDNGENISPAYQKAIRNSGSQVEALTGDAYDIEAELNNRVRTGHAFQG